MATAIRPRVVRPSGPREHHDEPSSGFQDWEKDMKVPNSVAQHPEFQRPVYDWEWAHVHTVTCTAEDSYGDQYPVSEAAPPGFALANMTEVEDDALDRCYAESGNDATCVLLACTHI